MKLKIFNFIMFIVVVIFVCSYNIVFADYENYPEKPIECIISFSSGGSSDLTMRVFNSLLFPEYLSQPLVLINKPGAGGSLGLSETARAKPDGYTIGTAATSGLTIIPLIREVPYSIEDLTPICVLMEFIGNITVAKDAPWNSLDELIEYSRENTVKYSTTGAWTLDDLVIKQLNKITGTEWVHVPFTGSPEAVHALMSGVVDVSCTYGSQLPYIKSGEIKALAICGNGHPLLPDVPTFEEYGYDIQSSSVMGILGPKDLPQHIVDKLEKAFYNVYHNTDYQVLVGEKLGYGVTWMGSEEYNRLNKETIKKMSEILKEYDEYIE
ncbi:MAG: tripartite tricarboxylate transporter substrate binding protein [Atribacterota bacterium]|nr:tripartite tricarboxylate transporter substrate binding protein [Atribacterota bacterium]MDD5659005.1 tripartite tricarboxylate transporter substrate binding protein [Actinomycetota bacterium]